MSCHRGTEKEQTRTNIKMSTHTHTQIKMRYLPGEGVLLIESELCRRIFSFVLTIQYNLSFYSARFVYFWKVAWVILKSVTEWQNLKELCRQFGLTSSSYRQGNCETDVLSLGQGQKAAIDHDESPSLPEK